MKVGIIDADLIGRKKHRFPNLASMKVSGYHKKNGDDVELLLDYDNIKDYDIVYISKAFTDTYVDESILEYDNVKYGGTGFFYDKAEPLPYEVEHSKPDYDLYKDWVNSMLEKGVKRLEFKYYLDYSIGFTTRGCFRKCGFCVNKNYNKVNRHSSVEEFLDKDRKYICLLDDNILGYGKWREVFSELQATGKRFEYKQGMDERTLTDEKVQTILNSKYKGDIIFAFDNIEDKGIIEEKLKLWRKYDDKKIPKFYVLCGFDKEGKYDKEFWLRDIKETFERIHILMKYKCTPYIMKFEKYEDSQYRGMYINIGRWCNNLSLFKKMSFREWANFFPKHYAAFNYFKDFEEEHPDIASEFFDIKYTDYN